jgi:hypothetical protein
MAAFLPGPVRTALMAVIGCAFILSNQQCDAPESSEKYSRPRSVIALSL